MRRHLSWSPHAVEFMVSLWASRSRGKLGICSRDSYTALLRVAKANGHISIPYLTEHININMEKACRRTHTSATQKKSGLCLARRVYAGCATVNRSRPANGNLAETSFRCANPT
jgi:hypothetical protein